MLNKRILLFIPILLIYLAGHAQEKEKIKEPHLKNIKQLTFGGDNAEAYFSFDDKGELFDVFKVWFFVFFFFLGVARQINQ